MSEVKVVLNRLDKTKSGVWIDGVRISYVKDVTVYGSALDIPQVVLTLVPEVITIDSYGPQIDKVTDGQQNL